MMQRRWRDARCKRAKHWGRQGGGWDGVGFRERYARRMSPKELARNKKQLGGLYCKAVSCL